MLSIPKLFHTVLLSLLLVFAQQGVMRHELTHHGLAASRPDHDKRPVSGDRCDICLAFAQVASAVAGVAFAPVLLSGIAFELTASKPVDAGTTRPPATRSRGPPIVA